MHRQIDQMLAWTAEREAKPEAGKPYLTERDGILALNFDVMSVQSEMYIDRPDELVISYTRAMMSFLLLQPVPKRIAMIGLGGGSLAKYCYRYLPSSEIKVIEISPDVIALRNEFAIPADDARFQVVSGDGILWVADTRWQPDVLILDGFDTGGLPEQLASQRFYDDCFVSLADQGILVANLWGGYPHYEEYLERIHNSFAGAVIVVDSEKSVNKVVIAVKNSAFPPSVSEIRQHANLLGLTHTLNFQAKCNKLIRALPGR
ncbi:MAG: transferase [Proteobacteria bacterium]|nr:transferase [Pseudomonadota bacterium]